jgi:hypothetical protein
MKVKKGNQSKVLIEEDRFVEEEVYCDWCCLVLSKLRYCLCYE